MADIRSKEGAQILYDRMAGIYDATFGQLIRRRQAIGIQELNLQPGDWVLDVGIGTGLSLDLYPDWVKVVGLDLSAGMLGKAIGRPSMAKPDRWLLQADALNPPFAPRSFDAAVITHVITCVPDPGRLMTATARLLKPGGRLLLLNHFRSSVSVIGAFERLLNPLCIRLGWRSDLSFDDATAEGGFSLEKKWKLRAIDLWTLALLKAPQSLPDASTPDA